MDTSLGYVVQIRSEQDAKKINQMTNQEKKIRSDWREFKLKNNIDSNKKIVLSKDEIDSTLSKLFG